MSAISEAAKNRAFGPTPARQRLKVPTRSTGVDGIYTRPALRYNSDRPLPNGLKPRPIPGVIPRKATRAS